MSRFSLLILKGLNPEQLEVIATVGLAYNYFQEKDK